MRGMVAGTLVVIGLLLVPFATVGIWMQRQILPTDSFSDLALDVVRAEPVTDALANRFLDELEAREPRLSLGRFVLEPAVKQAIGTEQFEQIFQVSVSDMHEQLLRGDDALTLNLEALLPIVKNLVAQVNTDVANQIPTTVGLQPITVVQKSDVPELWFAVEVTREASWVFPVLMVVAFAGAVLVATNRPLMLIIAGFGAAFVCLVVGLALRTARDSLSDFVGDEIDERAFNAGYDIITESLVNQTLLIGLLGLLAGIAGVVWMVAGQRRPRRPMARPASI